MGDLKLSQRPARDPPELGRGGLRGSWQPRRGEEEKLGPGPRSPEAKLFDAFYLKSRGSPAPGPATRAAAPRPEAQSEGEHQGGAGGSGSGLARERRDGE